MKEKFPSQEVKQILGEIEDLEAEKERLENGENKDEYDEMIDDSNAEIKIGSLTYSPSEVLKNVDETAYRIGLSEYNDERISEIDDEIKDKQEELKDLKEEYEEDNK